MKQLTSHEIRDSWVKFFESKGHKHLPSASLIPDNPTLLLTAAGMVPFVPYFLGLKEPPGFNRAVTIQKCTRVGGKDSDLENIGRTTRHHSFFEMLGNFSFGDYFKPEVIPWAWEYFTEVLELPKDKLIVGVFEGDDITPADTVAYDLWKKIGVPDERIRKLPRKEVFWGPPGPTGPCGPCSEIYFDRGDKYTDIDERYLELWNLVFMELEKGEDGKFKPLAKKNIDTGAGLERIALILQGKENTFETDLLRPILDNVAELTKSSYGKNEKDDLSLKIITDHIRCISFLISDGVRPSNLGRGYVLRMLTRRAARFGWLLGSKEPFLHDLASSVSDNYSKSYPELEKNLSVIKDVIKKEEEGFSKTIEKGLLHLDGLLSKSGKEISGEEAFDLYSTYGFPLELTLDIAKEKSKSIDLDGYEKAKEKHSEVSNKDTFSVKLTDKKVYGELLSKYGETKFLGYEKEECDSTVLALITEEGELVDSLTGKGKAILDQTVFYAESGGQVGDTGFFSVQRTADSDKKIIVIDTKKHEGLFTHDVVIKSGELKVGDKVKAVIDQEKRTRIMKHHSVTHLLHSALRSTFGEALQQAGSEVNSDRTRFDFTLDRAVKPEEIEKIETMVNGWIKNKLAVECKEMGFEEAKETGALMFFGDKYGDTVRVLKMGDASVELCGGTHVSNTSDIEQFVVVKESSISAGTRRIEAVAGAAAKEYAEEKKKEEEAQRKELDEIDTKLEKEFKESGLDARWEELCKTYSKDDFKQYREKHVRAKNALAKKNASKYADEIKTLEDKAEELPNGIKLLSLELKDFPDEAIRSYIEGKVKSTEKSVYVFANVVDGQKLKFFAGVSKDLVGEGIKAGKLVNEVAQVAGGRGGGKDSFAQAGGKDVSKVQEALETSKKAL